MVAKKRVRIDVDPELRREIKQISLDEDVSLTEASRILAQQLKELGRRKPKFEFKI